jgi:hypothetical protein
MKGAENFIKDYLNEKTEYAIQIIGNWGVGKTHYYKTEIIKTVKETPTLHDASKNYKPVYISLFGFKTIEDISTKIVLEFYHSKYFAGYFKSYRVRRILRISHGIFKIGLRGFMQVKGFGNLNYNLKDIKGIKKNRLTEHELFICFDDLERTDSLLSMTDLIGYINSLVDDGIKVLIINNEDAIASKDYINLKEKVVGVTIPFSLPTKEVVQSIIMDRFSAYTSYTKFLETNIDSLVDMAKATENNYRHLIYALTKFQRCYSEIINNIVSVNHEIKEQVEADFWLIAKTSIAIAIEYKASKLKQEDHVQFSNNILLFIDLLPDTYSITKTENRQDKLVAEKSVDFNFLSKKYSIDRSNFKFFKSIFDHLTNFEEFSIDNFVDEFRLKYRMVDGDVLPQYKILNSLSHGDCFNLSDEDYLKMTNEMIDFAEKGDYLPLEFLTVMFWTERLNNPFNLDLKNVLEKLKVGLKISIYEKKGNIQWTQFSMSLSENMSDFNKELHAFGVELFKQFKVESITKDYLQIQKEFKESTSMFISKYNEVEDFRAYVRTNHLFSEMAVVDFVQSLTDSDSATLLLIKDFFEERYTDNTILEKEKNTISMAIVQLTEWFDENKETKKLKSQLLKQLIDLLALAISE